MANDQSAPVAFLVVYKGLSRVFGDELHDCETQCHGSAQFVAPAIPNVESLGWGNAKSVADSPVQRRVRLALTSFDGEHHSVHRLSDG